MMSNYEHFGLPYNGENRHAEEGEEMVSTQPRGGAAGSSGGLAASGPRHYWMMADADDADTDDGEGGGPSRGPSRASNVDYNGSRYYYHSDHLGSSSLITDATGAITQQLDYLPYGEVFLEKRSQDPDVDYFTPYRFNGKELDEETGLYYYGARYMNPRLSIWYGTDPMQEKYPNVCSYCYTFNNPIRYSDPNGQDGWDEVKGFGAAIIDNVTGGLTNIRSFAGKHVSNPADFNKGLVAGDIASISLGAWEGSTGAGMVVSGSTVTTVGLSTLAPSGGASSVVVVIGGADAALGTGLVAHGAMMTMNAGNNLANKKGHLSEESKSSSSQTPKYSKEPPGKLTKLRGGQGWRDKEGLIWKRDMKHKNHYDVTDPKTGKKVKEVDYNGKQIWPNGPKNKNKK